MMLAAAARRLGLREKLAERVSGVGLEGSIDHESSSTRCRR